VWRTDLRIYRQDQANLTAVAAPVIIRGANTRYDRLPPRPGLLPTLAYGYDGGDSFTMLAIDNVGRWKAAYRRRSVSRKVRRRPCCTI
jgi:hypothetical protein